jgi:serine/threonine protein kinase
MRPQKPGMKPIEVVRECRGCGAEIKGDAPFGHCPRCLVTLGFSATTDPDAVPPAKPVFKAREFGDYQLLEQIGRGGMGVVYKARQVSLNRLVALKMVLDSQLGSPVVVRRFEIEAEAAARLHHPNIVPIYEIGEEEHQHFFSMKLIEGENLSHRMARGEFRPSARGQLKSTDRELQIRVAQLMIAVAGAVHYAHENGVLHRDIKPSNILVDDAGQPHLTDFGLAKLTDTEYSLSKTGGLMGTPSYMAPEQAAGGKGSVASDVYSLGIILYELLTGRLPFSAPTALETLRLITEQEPTPPATTTNGFVDLDLSTICLKCLEKNPAARFHSAKALADDLERWRRHEPIKARRAGPVLRVKRWTRRNPVGAALIVSLFLGLAVSLSLLRTVLIQKEAAVEARLTADKAREIIWQEIGVSDFWEKSDSTATISSEIIALVAGVRRSVPAGTKTTRYRIGMLCEEYPGGVIIGYARLLTYLEDQLSTSSNSVRLDLKIFQENRTGIDALVKHEVDILKIGGQSYLWGLQGDPGITALVAQNPSKQGVIFTTKDAGIKTLADLKGKRIAVNGTNSTVRLWGTFHLAQAGISVTDLQTLDRPRGDSAKADRVRRAPKLGKGEKVTGSSPIFQAVLTNGYHAGVISDRLFKRVEATNDTLVALKTFASSPVFWLAGSKVPPAIATGIKDAMVTLRDESMFKGLSDNVTSYSEVSADQLTALREAATTIREQFGDEREDSE